MFAALIFHSREIFATRTRFFREFISRYFAKKCVRVAKISFKKVFCCKTLVSTKFFLYLPLIYYNSIIYNCSRFFALVKCLKRL